MPKEIIRELVYRGYEAYALGHREFVVDLLDDDIEWTFHGPPEVLPVPNHLRGKAAVLAAYKAIDDVTELLGHKLGLVLVDGEHAAIIGETKSRHRASGRILQYKFAAFHLYRNGRLIQYQCFADTIGMAQQLLGRFLDLDSAYSAQAGAVRACEELMTRARFKQSLAEDSPSVDGVLAALWWTKKGDWERAHQIVVNDAGPDAAWVHAHLHRIEGDQSNADYWYRQARRPSASGAIDAEWDAIVESLLAT